VEDGIAQSEVWDRAVKWLDRNPALPPFGMRPHIWLALDFGQEIAEWGDCPCGWDASGFSAEHWRKEVAQTVREELVGLGELHISAWTEEAG